MIIRMNLDPSILKKIQKIKLVCFDCEGVLTLKYRNHLPEFSKNPVCKLDQQGLLLLLNNNIDVAIISAGKSDLLKNIFIDIGIKYIYLGSRNKLEAYEELKLILNISDEYCCHIGDGDLDIPVLEKVEFAVTVPEAADNIKTLSDYCTIRSGGLGAVEELCQLIVDAKNK